MKNPFKDPHKPTDDSAWTEWLTDDVPAHSKFPKPIDLSTNTKTNGILRHTASVAQDTPPIRSEQTVRDTARFQERQMQEFLSKRSTGAPSPPKPAAPKRADRKEIAVSISLPAVSLATIKQWRPSRRLAKSFMMVASLVLIVGLMVLTPRIINSKEKSVTQSSAGGAQSIPKTFAELKPENMQGVTNERYDASRGFYSFNDKYRGGNLTVTEQPLPDKVRGNVEEGKKLAQSVGATDGYETTQGMVYLTLSDTKTAQRAVLLHRQLLLFIQSTEPLAPTAWVDYVQSLK